jgi:hypothetical protein
VLAGLGAHHAPWDTPQEPCRDWLHKRCRRSMELTCLSTPPTPSTGTGNWELHVWRNTCSAWLNTRTVQPIVLSATQQDRVPASQTSLPYGRAHIKLLSWCSRMHTHGALVLHTSWHMGSPPRMDTQAGCTHSHCTDEGAGVPGCAPVVWWHQVQTATMTATGTAPVPSADTW